MARITVEDCLEQIPNRFELVMKTARRARQLANGEADPKVPWENDKCTVVALREAAEGYLNDDIIELTSVTPTANRDPKARPLSSTAVDEDE